jgi:hypothetical protein
MDLNIEYREEGFFQSVKFTDVDLSIISLQMSNKIEGNELPARDFVLKLIKALRGQCEQGNELAQNCMNQITWNLLGEFQELEKLEKGEGENI